MYSVQVGLDQLAGVLDEAVHEAGLDARVEAAPVGQGEEAEDSLHRYGGI